MSHEIQIKSKWFSLYKEKGGSSVDADYILPLISIRKYIIINKMFTSGLKND